MAIVGTQATRDGCVELEERDGQLLPGIPNEITLNKIAPNLLWRDLCVLACVNHRWLDAIRRREVYDARVRNHSTETLVCGYDNRRHFRGSGSCALFSMKDGRFGFELPPIPDLPDGLRLPRHSECVSLNGKIYVIGGSVELRSGRDVGTETVYVLDVAGQGPWKQCASMEEPRMQFGCAVLDGMIYVCGGVYSDRDMEPVCEAEVYDPTLDVWFPIEPMVSMRFCHKVANVGEELLAYRGWFHRDYYDSEGNMKQHCYDEDDFDNFPTTSAFFFEVYHPDEDEWRVVETSRAIYGLVPRSILFAAKGKFYHIAKGVPTGTLDILVLDGLDADEASWTHVHSFSFAGLGHNDGYFNIVHAVDDELLAEVCWTWTDRGSSLLQSTGFGSENKQIVWQELQYALDFSNTNFKCHIEL